MNEPSSSLVKLHIALPNHWWHKGESLWAKPLGNDLYRVENVPFCAYGLNYGDTVRAVSSAPELKPAVLSVIQRSGHQTLRFSFCDRLSRDQQAPTIAAIEALGGELERANEQFVCIDVPVGADYTAIRTLLETQKSQGTLEYETCEERVTGSFDDRPNGEPAQ